MKNFRVKTILALVTILTLMFTSCEKDEDSNPSTDSSSSTYIGTWVLEEVETYDEQTITTVATLVLTASTFDMTVTITEGTYTDLIGIKASLSVSGNQFTITPTSIGMGDFETGEMEWINEGDAGWEDALSEMEIAGPLTATFKIDGNKMTLTADGEAEIYTRK